MSMFSIRTSADQCGQRPPVAAVGSSVDSRFLDAYCLATTSEGAGVLGASRNTVYKKLDVMEADGDGDESERAGYRHDHGNSCAHPPISSSDCGRLDRCGWNGYLPFFRMSEMHTMGAVLQRWRTDPDNLFFGIEDGSIRSS